jgi:hypothetical protein
MPVQSSISIEHSEASINTIRLPSQNRRESNSIVSMNSSLFPPNTILDSKVISSPDEFDLTTSHEEQSSPLLVVGNAKKYSITQTQVKHQQTAIPTQRSIFHSRRDYGEVYVRHKVTSQILNIQFESLFIMSSLPVLLIQHQISMKNDNKLKENCEKKSREKYV